MQIRRPDAGLIEPDLGIVSQFQFIQLCFDHIALRHLLRVPLEVTQNIALLDDVTAIDQQRVEPIGRGTGPEINDPATWLDAAHRRDSITLGCCGRSGALAGAGPMIEQGNVGGDRAEDCQHTGRQDQQFLPSRGAQDPISVLSPDIAYDRTYYTTGVQLPVCAASLCVPKTSSVLIL